MPVIQILADIALWRRGPRDLPVSGPLLLAVIGLYVTQSAVQSAIATHREVAVIDGFADLVVTCVVFAALLAIGRRLYRLPQTLLAVLGTEILLSPLMFVLVSGVSSSREGDVLGMALRIALILMLVWNLLIVAHILRSAFDTSLAVAVLLAIACVLVSYEFTNLWLGDPVTVPGA